MPHPKETIQPRAVYTVTFRPGDVAVPEVPAGETLLRAAARAEVFVSSPCAGTGSCGKCLVRIESGQVKAEPIDAISPEDWQRGVRLACASRLLSDVVVRVTERTPAEAAPGAPRDVQSPAAAVRGRYLEAVGDEIVAGIVVVDTMDPAHTLPLLALAQGLYTDPQKPMMVDAGIYPIGEPGPESPVLLTTNFSPTYYTVVGEVENSKVPVRLLVMDVEGQSVLTAWAAGKFVADAIAPFIKKSGIEDKVGRRRLIIPGYVAGIQAELEAELGDWEVAVGVREAADIPRYLRALLSAR